MKELGDGAHIELATSWYSIVEHTGSQFKFFAAVSRGAPRNYCSLSRLSTWLKHVQILLDAAWPFSIGLHRSALRPWSEVDLLWLTTLPDDSERN